MKVTEWCLPANVAILPDLTGNEKVLYAYLSSVPNAASEPNTQAMADFCGVDKTTTLLAIKGLEDSKLIKVKRTKAEKLKRMIDIQVLTRKSSKAPPRKKTKKKRRR